MDHSLIFEDIPLESSEDEANLDWVLLDPRYDPPHTPSTTSDEAPPHPSFARESSDGESDEDADAQAHGELVPRRKPGGYDSRVEQMLYENPELPILILEAGKSSESGGRYIVYTIKTGVSNSFGVVGRCRANRRLARVHRNLLFVEGIRSLLL
jgi:hypothetical protein